MRSLRLTALVVLVALTVAPVALLAQRRISLGSIAPVNSLWDRSLKRMAADIQKTTDRRVNIQVRSGSQGDEFAIVRRLKLGHTQAATLTQIGLEEIDEAFGVLGMPFFFESDREARHVIDAMEPTFRDALAEQDLVLINWGHTGWAHLFSKDPISSLDELKAAKLYTSAGDDRMVRWYNENGFDPVPLSLSDVPVALNTGMINAYPFPPYAAMLLQYYRSAPHMLDLPLGPVIGATVMTTRQWNRVSGTDRDAVLSIGKRVEDELFRNVPQQDAEAVAEMRKRGLTVTKLGPEALQDFRQAADAMNTSMRGPIVPAAVYDAAVRARDAFRSR